MKMKHKIVKNVEFLLKKQVAVITLHVRFVNINGVGYVVVIILVITSILGIH